MHYNGNIINKILLYYRNHLNKLESHTHTYPSLGGPPFEKTLITHTQCVCNIIELC